MNVLITCAGRRNYLVEYFRAALEGRGHVFAADMASNAPALRVADFGFVLPALNHPGYFDEVLQLCLRQDVTLLISLSDLELPRLARQRARFIDAGVLPLISAPDIVDTCADKWATSSFLQGAGFETPHSFLSLPEARAALSQGVVDFPVVVKPRWGSGSLGIEYAENDDELELAYRLLTGRIRQMPLDGLGGGSNHSVIIQPRLLGQEYGLDVVNDLQGRYVTTFVKRKLGMRSGETDRAVTVHDKQLIELGERLGRELGHVGNLDCDVFKSSGICQVLELNPRFGGGYPFSHLAGANVPAAIIAWAEQREAHPEWLSVASGVMSAKFDSLVVVGNMEEPGTTTS